MAYKRAESNNFAEYQIGEGFGAAVTGESDTASIARLAQQNRNSKPAGLQGYEGYPDYLKQMGDTLDSGSQPSTREIAQQAQRGALDGLGNSYSMQGDEGLMHGFEGHNNNQENAFAGFEGSEDDAFAGYEGLGGSSTEEISSLAKSAALDGDDESAFDGYGGLGDTPMESFHTFFNKARQARDEQSLINRLAKAVAAVPEDAPMSVRQEYYRLAQNLLQQKKRKSMHHLDMQRAEIESNIGWLVNPQLPKAGGFDAMLNKAVGAVGAKLGKGEKEALKAKHKMALGKKLRENVKKSPTLPLVSKSKAGMLRSPFAGFRSFGEGNTMKYVGLGLAGLAVVGLIYCMKNKQAAPAAARRRNKRKK